jgi:hypothetical protein
MKTTKSLDPSEPRDWYIATWRKVFEELLGSAEPSLSRTIDRWREPMADENDIFYNGTPLSYAMAELIKSEYPDLPDYFNGREISRELEGAITPAGDYTVGCFPDVDPDYDWTAVRHRVRQVFDAWRNEFS